MAFYQKYRPQKFSDLVGQDHISLTLLEAIKSGKVAHAYLLTGPRGTGKTTTARLLAKAINCQTITSEKKEGKEISGESCDKCPSCLEISEGRALDVIEIDAASHTSVDDVREIIEKSAFSPAIASKKVYIIDEVHMLSKSAFNALLKTLEEPPAHLVFIFATTEAHKLPATIISRTQRFDFRRVSKEDIVKNLKMIAKKEKLEAEEAALDLIAVMAEGGHRDAVGMLEQIASFTEKITKSDVENILGVARGEEVLKLLGAIFNDNPEEGLKIAHRLFDEGIEMNQFNRSIVEFLRKILLLLTSGEILFEDTKENIESIKKLAVSTSVKKVVECIDSFVRSGELLKNIAYPILPIEMAIIESCSGKQDSIKSETQNPKSETNPNIQISNHKKEEPKKVEEHKEDIVEEKIDSGDKAKDATPVAVVQMTDDLWQRLISEVRKTNSTLAALLRDAKPLEINGEEIVLGAKFKFHKDRISETKNCKLIENIAKDLTGNKCRVVCKVSDLRPKKGESKPGDKDLVKAAEEIFK